MLSCSYYCCCFDFFLLFRFVRFYFSLLFCAVSYMSSCWSLVLYSQVFTDGLSWDACHGMNIHTDKTPAADFLSLLFLFDLKQAPTQTKWAILLMWFWLLLYSKSDWHPPYLCLTNSLFNSQSPYQNILMFLRNWSPSTETSGPSHRLNFPMRSPCLLIMNSPKSLSMRLQTHSVPHKPPILTISAL